MKKKILIFLGVILGVAAIVGITFLVIYFVRLNNFKNMDIKIPQDFKYTAHTGCNNTKDNSLESIEVAVEYGADIVEFDVRYNGTEHVLAHDEPKGGEVTLREAFLKIKEYEGLLVNVDIKETTEVGRIQELAEEIGVLDRIFFTGVKENFVKDVSENCPDVPYYLNMDVIAPGEHYDNYLKSIINRVKQRGAIGINFNKKNASKELVDAFHEAGLLVSIWTVNDTVGLYEILSYGPDNITTRRPDKMQEILSEIGE